MDCRPSQSQKPKGEAMSEALLLVLLLQARGDPQADKKPGAEPAAGVAEAQVKTEAVRGQKEVAQAKTKAAHAGTAKAQAEKKKPLGPTEIAQAKTKTVQEGAVEAQ